MELTFLFKGLIIGFSVAAPVGANGILCINRTLSQGNLTGFASGLGAATSHGIYGAIAGFGLTFISDFLIEGQAGLQLFGGIFLYYLGIKTFVKKPAYEKLKTNSNTLVNAYFSCLILTITNPFTILYFAAAFTGIELANKGATDYNSAWSLVLGIFIGSTSWWLILSCSVELLKHKLNRQRLQMLNQIFGMSILIFGFLILCQLLISGHS